MSFEDLQIKSQTFDLELRKTNTIRNKVIPDIPDSEFSKYKFTYLYFSYTSFGKLEEIIFYISKKYDIVSLTDRKGEVVFVIEKQKPKTKHPLTWFQWIQSFYQ